MTPENEISAMAHTPQADGSITRFINHHYRHFNAAALVDAAKGYHQHLASGGKMMITLAGAMSTAELGLSLAEMIRQDKVHLISCTGANLEEDVFNLVAHDYYERVPHYRQLSPQDEQDLLDRHMNRVTDTCIPEGEAMRRMETAMLEVWTAADQAGKRFFPHEFFYQVLLSGKYQEFYQIDPKDSWMLAAAEKNLPIIVPGWEDATLGNMYAAAVIRRDSVPLWGYFCQISDSTTSYGSYSGAVPNEKITWGKLGVDTPKFIIESDATIVAPLIFAHVLGW